VNNSGHLAGVLYDRTFSKHRAFIFANGTLSLLSGDQSRSYDMNDSDEVVGESLLPGKKNHGAGDLEQEHDSIARRLLRRFCERRQQKCRCNRRRLR
jgi:hypothetical protein